MNELPLILLGGMLGSAHCLGMCGAFVVSIGMGATSPRNNLVRQLVYAGGRVFTYSFLGVVAAFAGLRLGRGAGTLTTAQGLLSIAAGVILLGQGLASLGVPIPHLFKRRTGGGSAACLAGGFARPYLTSSKLESVFTAGILNGFLPCGLVYGYLALASSSGSLVLGPAVMAAFGLGTLPALALTGMGTSLVSIATRRRLFRLAGICVLITGVLAIGRGWTSLRRSGESPRCPACERNGSPLPSFIAGGG